MEPWLSTSPTAGNTTVAVANGRNAGHSVLTIDKVAAMFRHRGEVASPTVTGWCLVTGGTSASPSGIRRQRVLHHGSEGYSALEAAGNVTTFWLRSPLAAEVQDCLQQQHGSEGHSVLDATGDMAASWP